MVEGLKKAGKGKNWLQALLNIPRNIRNLYPHAYQSFVWNKVATRRFDQFGSKVVVGDLVSINEDQFEVVTADNIGKHSIYDISIPLIGSEYKHIDGCNFNQAIDEVLAAEGIKVSEFASTNK